MMSCLQGKEGALFIEIDFTWTLQTPLIQVLYSVYLRTVDRATIKIWILLAKCHSKSESNFPFRNSLKIFGCATNQDSSCLQLYGSYTWIWWWFDFAKVPSLSLSGWRTLTQEKIKVGWVLWCIKLQTIVRCWLEYSESMHSWLLSEVWNIIAPNLSIFSTEKIPRILNHQMVQGGDLIS